MKMGPTRSPWRYDVEAYVTLRESKRRDGPGTEISTTRGTGGEMV
jgi:hypothetical protein